MREVWREDHDGDHGLATDVACGMANLTWNRKLSDSDSVLLQLDLAGGGVESEGL